MCLYRGLQFEAPNPERGLQFAATMPQPQPHTPQPHYGAIIIATAKAHGNPSDTSHHGLTFLSSCQEREIPHLHIVHPPSPASHIAQVSRHLCFGYTVDIPNLGPWSPLITQAKNDLLDRLVALQRLQLWAQGQQAAGRQPTAEAIQIAPPAAAARLPAAT